MKYFMPLVNKVMVANLKKKPVKRRPLREAHNFSCFNVTYVLLVSEGHEKFA